MTAKLEIIMFNRNSMRLSQSGDKLYEVANFLKQTFIITSDSESRRSQYHHGYQV